MWMVLVLEVSVVYGWCWWVSVGKWMVVVVPVGMWMVLVLEVSVGIWMVLVGVSG